MKESKGWDDSRDIAVIGNYGQGNFGDDLLSDYVIRAITCVVAPNRLIVTGPSGSYLETWFPGILCVPMDAVFRNPDKGVRKIIFGGGGQFFAFPPATPRNVWGLRKATAFRFRSMIRSVDRRRLEAYAFCVGIGPLEGFAARWITRSILTRIQQISVRDEVSCSFLRELGVDGFRMVTDPAVGSLVSLRSSSAIHGEKIGIIVRYWPRDMEADKCIASLLQAAALLRDFGHTVEFISFQRQYDEPALELLRTSGEEARIWDPMKDTIQGFCKYLSEFRALVTMRAHGLYAGTLMGVPCIAVEIEPKLRIAAENCGLGAYVVETSSSPAEIVETISKAIEQRTADRDWHTEIQRLESETERLCKWVQS